MRHCDRLRGGLADSKANSSFHPKAIREGRKVEREHSSSPEIAEEIARDHLTEDKEYYRKLELMEKFKGSATKMKRALKEGEMKEASALDFAAYYIMQSLMEE